MNKICYLWLFTLMILSYQNKKNNSQLEETNPHSFNGKWLLVSKKNGEYYHCEDDNNFIKINGNKVYHHTPQEDLSLNIHHTKTIGNNTYLYMDQQESLFYLLNWIDTEKEIISCKFKNYNLDFFIKEQKLDRVKHIICDPIVDSCELTTTNQAYRFHIKVNEYSDVKAQQYPISAWISITNKKGKTQEIYFEPNSWSIYKKLPCHKFFVKDFNFDGLEDLAIVWDNSANGNELYEYYFQNKDGFFSISESFPPQHGLLAEDIDNVNKTIKTTSAVGCCDYNINIYKMKSEGNWEIVTSQKKIN